jgi:hypothetical protein
LRGACGVDFTVAMEQAGEAGGREAHGQIPVLAQHRGAQRHARNIDHDTLA